MSEDPSVASPSAPLPARPRKATGPERPHYLDGADIDRVMAVVLGLVSEVAAVRERLDTHEQLAGAGLVATAANVEAHRPTAEMEAGREAWRDAYVRRLFRVFTDDVDRLTRDAGKSA